ncbi:MAG TPA: putative quinol monooxygenase [Bryobacteraceae bacterium]|jgi:(4S)-4-hydroxy-5-phosphonooxypentane-2,3-dione isomerase|nr:putative quinol monooxygenase [Bryobacteraceae bacterium]
MIVLVVNYRVRPGTEELAKEYIRKMQEHTRKEPGCRLYVGHQSLEDPLLFCFYEQYADQAALDAHRSATYFAEYVTNGLATLAESRKAGLFEPV